MPTKKPAPELTEQELAGRREEHERRVVDSMEEENEDWLARDVTVGEVRKAMLTEEEIAERRKTHADLVARGLSNKEIIYKPAVIIVPPALEIFARQHLASEAVEARRKEHERRVAEGRT